MMYGRNFCTASSSIAYQPVPDDTSIPRARRAQVGCVKTGEIDTKGHDLTPAPGVGPRGYFVIMQLGNAFFSSATPASVIWV